MGTRLLGEGSTPIRLTAAVGLLLLSGGCGGGGSTAAPADPTSEATSASSSPSPDEGSSEAPSVKPASGPRLDGGEVSLNAPDGWVRADSMASWMHIAEAPQGISDVQLSETPGTAGGATTDQLAKISFDTSAPDGARRFADVTLDGVDFYHVAGTTPAGQYVGEYGADHLGAFVTVKFNLGPDLGGAERRDLIASVLASLQWA